jgi:hypothetical protein
VKISVDLTFASHCPETTALADSASAAKTGASEKIVFQKKPAS